MSLVLSSPVGAGGTNAPANVAAVQRALAELSELADDARLDPGPADGVCGDGTDGAISHLQRVYLHAARPDGRVDPGGRTLATLTRLLAIYGAACAFAFPVEGEPTRPYHGAGAGMRAFRASRSGGKRAHAGADLYRPVGTPVYAVARGVVSQVYPFYLGTYAVEVSHETPGGVRFVVRYGEVDPSYLPRKGEGVLAGEAIARVGQMRYASGKLFPYAMLHAELYTGASSGRLTTNAARDQINKRPFRRRADLVDITPLLRRAEA